MTKKRLIRTIVPLLLTIGLALWYQYARPQTNPPAAPAPPGQYRVTYVTDGDTFHVDMDGKSETVRMIGVDTPETKKPNTPVQCFGPQASDYTKKTLSGQTVRLETDPQDDNRDKYGRLLRYVYLPDGTLYDKQLVKLGYGFAYLTFRFSKQAEFATAQAEAQQAKLGLWQNCQPTHTGTSWQSNT